MYNLAKKVPHLNRMQFVTTQSFHECLNAEGLPIYHKRGFIREELYRQPDGTIIKAEVFYIQTLVGRFSDEQQLDANKRHHVWVQHPIFIRYNGKAIIVSNETNSVMKMLTDKDVPYDTITATAVIRNEFVPASFEFDGSAEQAKKVFSMNFHEFETHENELIKKGILVPSDVFQIIPGQISIGKGMHSSMACAVDDENPVTRLFDWSAISADYEMQISPEINNFTGLLIIGSAIKDQREPDRQYGVLNNSVYQSSAIVLSNTYDNEGAQILMELKEDANGTMKSFVDALHRDVSYILASGNILIHNNGDNLSSRFKASITSVPMIVPSAKLQSGAIRRTPDSFFKIVSGQQLKEDMAQDSKEEKVPEDVDLDDIDQQLIDFYEQEMDSQEDLQEEQVSSGQ